MQLTQDDLLDIIAEASYKLHAEIKNAYKDNCLDGYLASIGMSELIPSKDDTGFESYPDGKILIFGDSKIKDKEIVGCVKSLGIPADRVELHIGYDIAKRFDFNKLKYAPNYRLILFGPVPHSGTSKGEYSSILTQVENDEGYPKAIRLTDGHSLKITKTSLKNALKKEIIAGYINC